MSKPPNSIPSYHRPPYIRLTYRWVRGTLRGYWHRHWSFKILITAASLGVISLGTMFGVAQYYIYNHRNEPLSIGTSFIPAYAENLGLNPKDTMDALIRDVGVRRFRLVSYWSQLEPTPGQYDFSTLDWQFEKAEASGSKVTLALGLRQPRWPECHMPEWAARLPGAARQPRLEAFMAEVIKRYKDSPSLESYQLENEFYLNNFGVCPPAQQSQLVSEYNLVKSLDARHPVILSRSDNFPVLPKSDPTPDKFGISVYRRVWEASFLRRYFTYPLPSWHYASLAGLQQLATGKPSILHELQTEPWTPNYQSMRATSLAEQNKSFDAKRFRSTVEFGKATGMREIYLWGSEYWYYRKVKLGDETVWNAAKDIFKESASSSGRDNR